MAGSPGAPNLVGDPLDQSVITQLERRTQRLTQAGVRAGTDIRYLGIKNCWVRLTSFVSVNASGISDISNGINKEFPIQGGTYLAQQWALRAEQRAEDNLKYGVNNVTGAYGSGGIGEIGYRPMPGIQSITVESQPPLGAVNSATVKIKAWNLNQLSMLDILYFRLGFSMLLEWGHSIFVGNDGKLINGATPIDAFQSVTKEDVLKQLAKKRKAYSHNYDGMLGLVTNYDWTQNPDGSYDCTLRLSGIGSIIESLKINTQDNTPTPVTSATPSTTTSTTPSSTTPTTTQIATPDDSSLKVFTTRIGNAWATELADPAFYNKLFDGGLDLLNNPTPEFTYGYNTSYMISGNSTGVPEVNRDVLCSALKSEIEVITGAQKQIGGFARYIPLSLLLAYINNSCLIYDKSKSKNRPAIYIDFNPETNYCLRIPQQFSVDPGVCLVDTNCSADEYAKLFSIRGINISSINAPGTPADGKLQLNTLSAMPNKYIDTTNPYKGRFMNIVVNIDCIKATIDENTDSDKNVFLSPFLSSLMKKIQVALGNINNFKVGYNETANTVTIYDAQLVDAEARMKAIPTIPVFGLVSAVREYSMKTEASSKIGSMLAIQARAGARNTGTNTDGTAFTVLNRSLQDRLLEGVSTTAKTTATSTTPPPSLDGVIALGNTFNGQVSRIYEIYTSKITYDTGVVESIKQFYIDSMLLIKGEHDASTGKIDSVAATGILPLALNIKMDGIGGIPLYQAFTVPANRLPAQYLNNGKPRVGFTVAGLTHTIENNQWTTAIRGLMINIPNDRRVYTPNYQSKLNTTPNLPPVIVPNGKQLKVFTGAGLEPIKQLINTVEGNYNSYNYYKVDAKGKRRLVSVINGGTAIVTETIADIQAKQRNKTYFAVGKFQAIPGTLDTIVKALSLSPTTIFDAATQEKVGEYLLLKTRATLGNYLQGKNAGTQADLEKAIQAAGQEWASLPIIFSQGGAKVGEANPGDTNVAYYGGQGGNKSTSRYNVRDIAQNLIRSRIQYSSSRPNYIPPYYIS